MPASRDRLDVLKALGDNTRYAIYLELARSARPLSTSQIAEELGLHGNTVREHLERMRDVGLLEAGSEPAGGVGRPQKLYSLAPDAPSLGLEPPIFPMLARMLIDFAQLVDADPEHVIEAGRVEGRRRAQAKASDDRQRPGEAGEAGAIDASVVVAVDRLRSEHEHLGFDPAVIIEGPIEAAVDGQIHKSDPDPARPQVSMAFTRCPVADLAAKNPGVVCALHRGLVEGLIEGSDGLDLEAFNDVSNREPCRMTLIASSGPAT